MFIMNILFRGMNPRNAVLNELSKINNPMADNLKQMIENNDVNGIENMVRNAGKEKGINVDELKRNLENQLRMR